MAMCMTGCTTNYCKTHAPDFNDKNTADRFQVYRIPQTNFGVISVADWPYFVQIKQL